MTCESQQEIAGIYGLGYSLPGKRQVRIATLKKVRKALGGGNKSNTLCAKDIHRWMNRQKKKKEPTPSFILSVAGGASNFMLRRR